jgi:hypothetical protein
MDRSAHTRISSACTSFPLPICFGGSTLAIPEAYCRMYSGDCGIAGLGGGLRKLQYCCHALATEPSHWSCCHSRMNNIGRNVASTSNKPHPPSSSFFLCNVDTVTPNTAPRQTNQTIADMRRRTQSCGIGKICTVCRIFANRYVCSYWFRCDIRSLVYACLAFTRTLSTKRVQVASSRSFCYRRHSKP